jgi:hypothetical protein
MMRCYVLKKCALLRLAVLQFHTGISYFEKLPVAAVIIGTGTETSSSKHVPSPPRSVMLGLLHGIVPSLVICSTVQ